MINFIMKVRIKRYQNAETGQHPSLEGFLDVMLCSIFIPYTILTCTNTVTRIIVLINGRSRKSLL